MRPPIPILLIAGLSCCGCATTHPDVGREPGTARWPYAGLNEIHSAAMGAYQGRFFSGTRVEFDGAGGTLFAEAGEPGLMTLVRMPEGAPGGLYDLGSGVVIENLEFDPDGTTLYVMASTIRPENLGEVQLARALLKIDTSLPLLQAPIPLRIGGYSHGLALLPRRGLIFTLDSAGAGVSNGAMLSRVDVIADEATLRRPVGSLPLGLDRRGLAVDELQNIIFALLASGGGGSDFDPPEERKGPSVSYIGLFEPDSLNVIGRLPLEPGLDYVAIAPSPRGVLVLGTSAHRSALVEIDTRLMKEVGWIDLPRGITDVAVSEHRAVLPGPGALYIVDLDLFTTRTIVPLGVEATGEAAITPDGRTAALLFEDFSFPGHSSLALIDLDQGRLIHMVR